MAQRSHLVLFGGFLGAGKTSAMIAFAGWLAEQGIRAGFVTNDQGSDLVDTQLLRHCGLQTEEVSGGCFCCRFDDLVDATHRLRAVMRPDVFAAEAVGSCTDLAATVIHPVRRLLGDQCTVGPLSVMVDPRRATELLLTRTGPGFSEDIQYVFRKQLEEADLIVVNKSELLSGSLRESLGAVLREHSPAADVLFVSVERGEGLAGWFHRLLYDEPRIRPTMDVDYDRYATGEADLGWCNATVRVESVNANDGNVLLSGLAGALRQRFSARHATIAHLKMTLDAGNDLAAINLVGNDVEPESALRMKSPVVSARLTINVRAESAPEAVADDVHASLAALGGWRCHVERLESFRPGRPQPTHRDSITPSSI